MAIKVSIAIFVSEEEVNNRDVLGIFAVDNKY